MSEIKAKQMTAAQIKTLSEYEDKLRRALDGDTIALSSVQQKRLEAIHFEVFGVRQSMVPCCGGMRTTAARLTPLAKAYFEQTATKKVRRASKTKAKARKTTKKAASPTIPAMGIPAPEKVAVESVKTESPALEPVQKNTDE